MFDWLWRWRRPGASRAELPTPKGQVSAEARQYLEAIKQHLDRPFVRHHFHQVTWMSYVVPGHEAADFCALEFRAGSRAALIWMEAPDRWCVGWYVPLAHPDADITCPPSGLTPSYWRERIVCDSLAQAVVVLEAATPEPYRRADPEPR